jgi:hypothetical protein
MRSTHNTEVPFEPGRAVEAGSEVMVEAYLDLDGDGVPDAVQMVERVSIDASGDGHADVIELRQEIARGIGVDGIPEAVDVVDRTTIELDHKLAS